MNQDPASGLTNQGGTWSLAGAPLSSAGKRLGAAILEGVLVIFTLGLGWLVWSLVVWSKGQTPAKSLLGMRCVNTGTGRTATWGTMVLREIVGKVILGSFTFGLSSIVGCFMVLGSTHQGLWDKVATTAVVNDR